MNIYTERWLDLANIHLFLHSIDRKGTWNLQVICWLGNCILFKVLVLCSTGDYMALEWQGIKSSLLVECKDTTNIKFSLWMSYVRRICHQKAFTFIFFSPSPLYDKFVWFKKHNVPRWQDLSFSSIEVFSYCQ